MFWQDGNSVHDIRERRRGRLLVAGACHVERVGRWRPGLPRLPVDHGRLRAAVSQERLCQGRAPLENCSTHHQGEFSGNDFAQNVITPKPLELTAPTRSFSNSSLSQ